MMKYKLSGDTALIIKAGDEISEEINGVIRKILIRIESENIDGVVDFIPSYNELMICFDPLLTDFGQLTGRIRLIEDDIGSIELPDMPMTEVPVLYGGQEGPDLAEVAENCKMTPEDVINIHCSAEYMVYMLGFTPGFCYLGGMDNRIATPRKKDPRLKIPAGSVGIADYQTGIYPLESPGGWQVIGKTPIRLFDPHRSPEFIFRAGDRIRFRQISENEYDKIEKEINGMKNRSGSDNFS